MKNLAIKLVHLLAGKLAGQFAAWIGAAIAVAICDAFAWFAAHLPVVAAHYSPAQVTIWVTVVVVAPLINYLGNLAFQYEKDKNPELAETIESVASAVADTLAKNPPIPVVKAEPVEPGK